MVAVIGPNIDRWQSLIESGDNFAGYYLFVRDGDEQKLDQVIQTQPLVKAKDTNPVEETNLTLVELLRSQAQ